MKSLELSVPDLAVPLIFDNIDAVYSTKGLIQIKLVAEGECSLRKTKSSSFGFVTGTLCIVNTATGAVESVKVSLPYSTNWE